MYASGRKGALGGCFMGAGLQSAASHTTSIAFNGLSVCPEAHPLRDIEKTRAGWWLTRDGLYSVFVLAIASRNRSAYLRIIVRRTFVLIAVPLVDELYKVTKENRLLGGLFSDLRLGSYTGSLKDRVYKRSSSAGR